MQPQPLAWCDPLPLAQSLGNAPMVLLYSGAAPGQVSILATHLVESVDLESFDALDGLLRTCSESFQGASENSAFREPHRKCMLDTCEAEAQKSRVCSKPSKDYEQVLAQDQPRYANSWFGYLGYEMRHDAERYSPAQAGQFGLPRGRLMRFADIYVFDHAARSLTLWSEHPRATPTPYDTEELPATAISTLSSNMTRKEYEEKVAVILEEIRKGSLYQANLTRKFFGTFKDAQNGLALFRRLCRVSPAAYSAYLRMPEAEVLSSSPELFLQIDADGTVTARPIKGTAPRGKTALEDEALQNDLQGSAKNRAENLMITDLMRSDLAKHCVAGSVEVKDLFDVTAHANIFHMASTVRGKKSPGATLGKLLRGAFPPGSMTGAPKIRAVELCNALEKVERGIYSGAIGWFGGDGSAMLSVVIRTLILQENRFEFQVGGGIVADSSPAGEWQETMDKALGIIHSLGISRGDIESL